MREFDLQVKVIRDFEKQELDLQAEDTDQTEGGELEYLKLVNQKIQKDLLHIREVFRVTNQSHSQLEAPDLPEAKESLNQHVQQIQELIENGFS